MEINQHKYANLRHSSCMQFGNSLNFQQKPPPSYQKFISSRKTPYFSNTLSSSINLNKEYSSTLIKKSPPTYGKLIFFIYKVKNKQFF